MRWVALVGLFAIGCVRSNPNRFQISGAEYDLAKADDVGPDLAAVDLASATDFAVSSDFSTESDLAGADLKGADFAGAPDFAMPLDFAMPRDFAQPPPDLLMADLLKVPPMVTCPSSRAEVPFATISLTASGYDPDGGFVNYQWAVVSAPGGSTSQPVSPNSGTTNFYLDKGGNYQLSFTVTDNEGASASCTVNIKAAILEVELTWSTAYGDVDLQVTRQSSSWYTDANACWWSHSYSEWGPSGTEGNADLDLEDFEGFGPERVRINNPAAGTYEIGANYWCANDDGATVGTVTIKCNGTVAATYSGIALEQTGRFVHVANVTMPGCVGQSVMNPTWTALVQPLSASSLDHCGIPCASPSPCTPGEKCVSPTSGSCVFDR